MRDKEFGGYFTLKVLKRIGSCNYNIEKKGNNLWQKQNSPDLSDLKLIFGGHLESGMNV
jgi:hypothetical protein